MQKIRLLELTILLVLLSGCTGKTTVTPAFYVWKSKLSAQDADASYLNRLDAKKFYLRLFDVDDKGNGALPMAEYSPDSCTLNGDIISVIFLTNRTFLRCPPHDIDALAEKCIKKMNALYASRFGRLPQEYQFDCDWTEKTKEAYFGFLQSASRLKPEAAISCTIRLHQIKYSKQTGIPPVGKGVLIYYATSEPTDFDSTNTILDNKEASLYIEQARTYPLHLDVALPLYSWGIVRNPFSKIKLINGVCEADVSARPEYYKKLREGVHEILQSHYLRGMWLNKGYELKVEEVSPEALQEAAATLQKKLKQEDRELIFHHLDEDILKRYPASNLQDLLKILSK
ncbi:MAG: hypothetical protein LUE99_18430 [Bacteroides sp.]|nr:hypothetical protein [Bacteroides sp.]